MSNLDPECVYIACSSDENYAMPLAVMLTSLVINLRKYKKTHIFILESGITPDSKQKILRSVVRDGVDVQFIIADASLLSGMKVIGHVSSAAYLRFLIGDILPQDLNKIIYLDCDLIVQADISGLWDIPIGENIVLAVPEQRKELMFVSSRFGLINYKELGLSENQKYFNSGVLVVNLETWRKNNIGSMAVQYIKKNRPIMRLNDEEALNALLANRWAELDYRWNLLTQTFPNTKRNVYLNSSWDAGPIKDKATYERLIRHPYIIHFNTSSKPWMAGCEHPYKKLFFYYLDKTDWKGWRAPKRFRAWIKKMTP